MTQKDESGEGQVRAHKGVKMKIGAFRKFGVFASLAFVLFAAVGVLNLRWVQEPLGRSFAFVIGRELARSAAVVFLFLSYFFLTAKSKKSGVLGLVGVGFLIVGQLVAWGILLGNERLLRDSLQLIGKMWEIVLIAGTVGWFFLFLSFVSLTRMGRWSRMVAIWAVGAKFLVGACWGVGPLCAWTASLLVPGQELDFIAWDACLNSDIVSCVSLGSSVLLFLSVLSLARGKVSEMGESMPFSFEGRTRRRDYWLWCLWCAFFQVVLAIPIWALYSRELMAKGSSVFWLWMVAAGLFQFLMMIPMCVCRLHDVGMSGWWLVLLWVGCWIPGLNIVAGIASFVIFGCLDGTVGPNRFGDDTKDRRKLAEEKAWAEAHFVDEGIARRRDEVGYRDGEAGANRFGDEPRGVQRPVEAYVADGDGSSFFEGRACRRDYWLCHVGLSLILGIMVCCIMFSRGQLVGEPLGLSLFTWTRDLLVSTIVCGVIYGFLMLPVCVRRLHDVGMSGWWLVLLWGGCWIPGLNIIAGIACFVIFGCLDGTVGPNRFGDDPRGRQPWGANLSVPVVPVAPPGEQPAARSPESRLAKVRELYEKGLLTEEEYKAQRAAIIAEI